MTLENIFMRDCIQDIKSFRDAIKEDDLKSAAILCRNLMSSVSPVVNIHDFRAQIIVQCAQKQLKKYLNKAYNINNISFN